MLAYGHEDNTQRIGIQCIYWIFHYRRNTYVFKFFKIYAIFSTYPNKSDSTCPKICMDNKKTEIPSERYSTNHKQWRSFFGMKYEVQCMLPCRNMHAIDCASWLEKDRMEERKSEMKKTKTKEEETPKCLCTVHEAW